jgi:IS5 family transposase
MFFAITYPFCRIPPKTPIEKCPTLWAHYIHQPHIRPIVRGKASASTEFGAKLSISVVDGYVFQDKISWEPYNEGKDLIDQIQKYYCRFGFYPESVHADKIYQNRENNKFCKNLGIRLSGPKLGRPSKDQKENKEAIKQIRQDEKDRIPVEGKFGNGKRKYGLDRIMAKRADTSKTVIGVTILVMNLEKIMRDLFFFFTKASVFINFRLKFVIG